MKYSILLVAAFSALVSTSALANQDLAQKKNCLACHGVKNKIVGPSYESVAKKYAKEKGAEDKLVERVMKGGKGNWGEVAMPANGQVNEAEARTLVKWILALPVSK